MSPTAGRGTRPIVDTFAVQGDNFLAFEVNAIHNLVHVASGVLLLAAWPRRGAARAVALGFGLVYGLVAIIGLIDGEDVLGLIPINGPDNILHVALAAAGVIAGLISRDDDRDRGTTVLEPNPTTVASGAASPRPPGGGPDRRLRPPDVATR